ncbi:MAG: hypothetical protein M3P33_03355 [bacterium]|nr:hypothetical protein [bacterium]
MNEASTSKIKTTITATEQGVIYRLRNQAHPGDIIRMNEVHVGEIVYSEYQ